MKTHKLRRPTKVNQQHSVWIVALSVAFGATCVSVYVSANEEFKSGSPSNKAATPPVLVTLSRSETNKLFSSVPRNRSSASSSLTRFHNDIERLALSQIEQQKFWMDKDAEGVVPPVMTVLGFYGSELSVRSLTNHISFEIDPKTVPHGESRSVIAGYPVAATLAQIGGLEVRRNVLQKLYRTESERELRLCLWVLNAAETPDVTKFLIDLTRQDASKRVATEEVLKTTANLKRAQKLMETPNDILNFESLTP